MNPALLSLLAMWSLVLLLCGNVYVCIGHRHSLNTDTHRRTPQTNENKSDMVGASFSCRSKVAWISCAYQ